MIRSAKLLGIDDPIVGDLMTTVRDAMGPSYPELVNDFDRIHRIAVAEETAFNRTLASGSRLFEEAASATKASGTTVLSGTDAFTLHDTRLPARADPRDGRRGRPVVDEEGFRGLMAEQRQRAKADAAARKQAHEDLSAYRELVDAGPTEFTGFDELISGKDSRHLRGRQRVPVVTHGTNGWPRPSASSWCWTAPRSTPSPAARSPTRAASPAPVHPVRRRRRHRREDRQNAVGAPSTWSPASSSRATPWSRPSTRGGGTARRRVIPAPTWCMPHCDKCWAPTPFRPAR